jgi:hypothetical protein
VGRGCVIQKKKRLVKKLKKTSEQNAILAELSGFLKVRLPAEGLLL